MRNYIIISIVACMVGGLWVALHHDWIVLRFPRTLRKEQAKKDVSKKNAQRAPVVLYFFHNNKWHTEKTHVLISDDHAQTIHYLVQAWLTVLEEEHVMDKKVTVQSVLVSSAGCAYISFDRNPLIKDASTYEKYMWVEGLLETLRENNIKIHTVSFLVHHKPLQDYHLDFSQPWPLRGFLQE